jgi:hypothetical protein
MLIDGDLPARDVRQRDTSGDSEKDAPTSHIVSKLIVSAKTRKAPCYRPTLKTVNCNRCALMSDICRKYT